MVDYDALIVGARCAGATLATRLAQGGWRVLMLDRDPLGPDGASTHVVFPDTLRALDELGVLDALGRRHELHPLRWQMRLAGHELDGRCTAAGGFGQLLCLRRPVLDDGLVDAALAAGADARLDERVTGVIGSGPNGDSVQGVTLADGERITARWVFGVDGRDRRVIRKLTPPADHGDARDGSMLLSYWRGLPPTDVLHLNMAGRAGVSWLRCEDDVHLLISHGSARHAAGDCASREAKHLARLREFPATLDPRWLAGAQRISEVRVVPETMARCFVVRAAGSGWVLAADTAHLRRSGAGNGIGAAIAHSLRVSELLLHADPVLAGGRSPAYWARGSAEAGDC